jgi:hypothetical protein
VTIYRGGGAGWAWVIRPLEDEPLAWALRDNLQTPEQAEAEAEAWGRWPADWPCATILEAWRHYRAVRPPCD